MAEDFLTVIDADEAKRRYREAISPAALPGESVPLDQALGRVLSRDVVAAVDVPGFDRSNVDGYAVRAVDTFGASEAAPRTLKLTGEEIPPGIRPSREVLAGEASYVATGGMIPRGADAMVMVEHVELLGHQTLLVHKPATPGARISFAGSDMARGEVVMRRGTRLSARETGTLAAIGASEVSVHRRPQVAVFSTGNEIVTPGEAMTPGNIYDSNLRILVDALRELGAEPIPLGVVEDDAAALKARIREGLDSDLVLLSGGTSKGEGDLGAQTVAEMGQIICHGVAVKPGKPICLAVVEETPVVILPGFPTSAVFTFHEFVVPLLLELAGAPPDSAATVTARVPFRIDSDRGRAEFVLVNLIHTDSGLVAYPMGKGSGSITTFARADGFIRMDRQQEYVEKDESVTVRLIGREIRPADLVFVGSHCLGLDYLLSLLRRQGFTAKALIVGSQGGLHAAERGECDVAGIHLCDEHGVYNTPFLSKELVRFAGYGREQGVVFLGEEPDLASALMVNRNRGSGTRILIDELLGDQRPPGYAFEARSHNAVAVAVAQERADWGVAIRGAAELYGLGFRPLREEQYDFVAPANRVARPAVEAFRRILASDEARLGLAALGFNTDLAAEE